MSSYSLLAIIAIGVASNLDNAGVGIAYGVRKIHIPWYSNLTIAFISFLATLVSGLFGNLISTWMPPWIGQLIGTIVIIGVGVWVLVQPYVEKSRLPKLPPPIHLHVCSKTQKKRMPTAPNRLVCLSP